MCLPYGGGVMLEFDDLQYIIATRVPALTGRYEFLSFREPAQGRAWLDGILDKVASVQQVERILSSASNGGCPLHLPGKDFARLELMINLLATFPKEFRDGMVAWGRSAR